MDIDMGQSFDVNTVVGFISAYGLQVIGAALILFLGLWVAKRLSIVSEKLLTKTNTDPILVRFVRSTVYIAVSAFVVIAALSQVGIQTTSFIAVMGAAGLAVGMALQGSLSNFAAGVLLVIFKPFKVGDYIKAGGEEGVVKEITIFNTILDTLDHTRVIVPNAQVTSGSIKNLSTNAYRRVDLLMSISYSDDITKAKRVLMDTIENHPAVLNDPAPIVNVGGLGESSVDLNVWPYVAPENYWDAYFDLTEQCKLALEAAGMTIPFPQQDVWLKEIPSASPESISSTSGDKGKVAVGA